MKCRTCDRKANPLWHWYCNECQAIGAFFQYEQNHMWSTNDTEEQFTNKLNAWKRTLTDADKDYILNVYWKS